LQGQARFFLNIVRADSFFMTLPHARIPLTLMLFLYTVYKEKGASVQGAPLARLDGEGRI